MNFDGRKSLKKWIGASLRVNQYLRNNEFEPIEQQKIVQSEYACIAIPRSMQKETNQWRKGFLQVVSDY